LNGGGVGAVAEKIPKWECELWSYMSRGDGMHCPLYTHCRIRQRRSFCADDSRELLTQIFDSEQFNPDDYGFLRFEKPGRIFQAVATLARRYLRRARIAGPPVPSELISLFDQQHVIEVRLLPLTAHHGGIWRVGDKWVIQLRRDDTPARRRFTLFHEAFHILAHCKSKPVFRKRGVEQGCFNEVLADCFSTRILMPTEWVIEKWPEVKDLDRMAGIFDVPKSVMWLTIRALHLV
jgi:hypothetical protein